MDAAALYYNRVDITISHLYQSHPVTQKSPNGYHTQLLLKWEYHHPLPIPWSQAGRPQRTVREGEY